MNQPRDEDSDCNMSTDRCMMSVSHGSGNGGAWHSGIKWKCGFSNCCSKHTREPRHQAQLQKLGWKLEENWHTEAPITCAGFRMLFEMLWHQHDEEHIYVLLKFAKQLRELHQAEKLSERNRRIQTVAHPSCLQGVPGTLQNIEERRAAFLEAFPGISQNAEDDKES